MLLCIPTPYHFGLVSNAAYKALWSKHYNHKQARLRVTYNSVLNSLPMSTVALLVE